MLHVSCSKHYIHSVTKVPYLSPEINKISLEETVRPTILMNSKVSKGKVIVHFFGTVLRVLIQCLRNASSPITFLAPKRMDGRVILVRSRIKEACCLSSAAGQVQRQGYPVSFSKMGDIGIHISCTKWESHGGKKIPNCILNTKH